MPTDPGRYVPVNTSVLLQTLVEAVHEQVEERRAVRELIVTPPALDADHGFVGDNDPALERALRVCGYLARVVEVELFEPARQPAGWVAGKIGDARARAGNEDQAVAELCGDLARAEPIGKPSRDDPQAMSWQVPGPGGHVRHHVARRAIEELLRDRTEPVEGDPADLKRAWMYGFFVRTCEEALPADAASDSTDG
ncbi:MAG TPA: hypothetical protein VGR11_03595 [Solirubrobacteraceae bacterium]|nr:hypothetical protein [Solirubrobacteraceae bacterium]